MVKNPPTNARDVSDASLMPGLERSPGEGLGNPLQYFCLENPMDRGWRATVRRVAESDTSVLACTRSSSNNVLIIRLPCSERTVGSHCLLPGYAVLVLQTCHLTLPFLFSGSPQEELPTVFFPPSPHFTSPFPPRGILSFHVVSEFIFRFCLKSCTAVIMLLSLYCFWYCLIWSMSVQYSRKLN